MTWVVFLFAERVLSAIRYMHDNGVVHRDLKFENIMFESSRNDASVKIIDFGLSKKFLGSPGIMTDRVGTIYTMAPQVLQGMYSSKADIWSIGVIAYMLLSASKPFHHKRRRVVIDKIMRGSFNFDSSAWESISEEAMLFITHLLVVNPGDRPDAEEALKHEWIQKREDLPDRKVVSTKSLNKIHDNLSNYRHTSELKKLALTVIAHRSTQKEILKLREVFEQFDTEKNGILSYEEFHNALKKTDFSKEMLDEIFHSVDINKNGHIMWTEVRAERS